MESVSIRCGLVVRIPGSHPGGRGSIHGTGTYLFGTDEIFFNVLINFRMFLSLYDVLLAFDTKLSLFLKYMVKFL